MQRPLTPDERSRALAARQFGIISRSQALDCGMTARMIETRVATGDWERAFPKSYAMAGAPNTWRGRLLAALLSIPRGAVASHGAAAALHGLAGCAEGALEVTIPSRFTGHRDGVTIHTTDFLPDCDVTQVGPIATTTVARTLIDLSAGFSARQVEIALDDALRRGLVSLPRLQWRIDEVGRRGRRGCSTLRRLVEQRSGRVIHEESELEKMFSSLVRRHRLPEPVLQYCVRDRGRVLARVDFAYPEAKIAIEIDSYQFHSSRRGWARDKARHNAISALGWLVFHLALEDLRAHAATAARIKNAYERRCSLFGDGVA